MTRLVNYEGLVEAVPGIPSRRLVERLVREGAFPGTRVSPHAPVVFDLEAVQRWIAERAAGGQA